MADDLPADAAGPLAPPDRRELLGEVRVVADAARMLGALALSSWRSPGDRRGPLVILAPHYATVAAGGFARPVSHHTPGYLTPRSPRPRGVEPMLLNRSAAGA